MKDFWIKQQLPSPEEALRIAEASLSQKKKRTCECKHLLKIWPDELDWTTVRTASGTTLPSDPIQGLHFEAHWNPRSDLDYGVEQERTRVIQTPGLSPAFHSQLKGGSLNSNPSKQAQAQTEVMPSPVEEPQKLTAVATENKSSDAIPNKTASGGAAENDKVPAEASTTLPKIPDQSSSSSIAPERSNAVVTRGLTAQLDETDSDFRAADEIARLQNVLKIHRTPAINSKTKKRNEPLRFSALDAWKHVEPTNVGEISDSMHQAYNDEQQAVVVQVERMMEHYRTSRYNYWDCQAKQKSLVSGSSERVRKRPFGYIEDADGDTTRDNPGLSCTKCERGSCLSICDDEDDLMKCLDCGVVACGPRTNESSILEHFALSNHAIGVTCGPKALIYCAHCDEFISHENFRTERLRTDLQVHLPWMAWKAHPIQRSLDALRFVNMPDVGIVWKGLRATYPSIIPDDHKRAAQATFVRQSIWHGRAVDTESTDSEVKRVEELQSKKESDGQWKISAPIGIYNLGNTCYQSAVFQCLVNCMPIQRYFLNRVGHHYASCEIHRGRRSSSVCLACELDKMLLQYYGSTIGADTLYAMEVASKAFRGSTSSSAVHLTSQARFSESKNVLIGEPVATTDMLAATWQSKGMEHLAGYEQRDAHEFLHGFLDILDKDVRRYRDLVKASINIPRPNNAVVRVDQSLDNDFVRRTFEGKLRSVLVCQECGNKRTQLESFMSISLPLSPEVQKATTILPGDSDSYLGNGRLSVERCLRHFVLPELLASPIDCPSCGKKTPTKKQHVVSKLPKVLCLHLKRFDAAENKKIEDFVSFPAQNLNMGPFLPQWSEVTSAPERKIDGNSENPDVLYSLFGTVNHFGNLLSGHYVSNVKVGEDWYHCNDSFIGRAGVGTGEREVLQSNAYILFYIRD